MDNFNDFLDYLNHQGMNFNNKALGDAYSNNNIVKNLINGNFIPSLNNLSKMEQTLQLQGSLGTQSILNQVNNNRQLINTNAALMGTQGGVVNQQLAKVDNNAASQMISLQLNKANQMANIENQRAQINGEISQMLSGLK